MENAWGVDEDLDLSLSQEESDTNSDLLQRITENSQIAWKHFVVGSVDSGMALLKR